MLHRLVKENLRSGVLIASTLAALLAGTGMPTAQPGAEFQNQGIREDNGLPRFGELRARRAPRAVRITGYSCRRKHVCLVRR